MRMCRLRDGQAISEETCEGTRGGDETCRPESCPSADEEEF